MKRKWFIRKRRFSGIHAIDQYYLNNGGHDEFIIFKFNTGYKTKTPKFCVVEYDIYGKNKSYIMTEEELVDSFGEEILKKIPKKANR